MVVKQIVDEDFVNYKEPSMLVAFSKCLWRCGKEHCHNIDMANLPDIEICAEDVAIRYVDNFITSAVVCSGLEPFDTFHDLYQLVEELRDLTEDTIIIYTGYTEDEIAPKIEQLQAYRNIVVKFGRYKPNLEKCYDELLGVTLASNNQYAKQIS